MIIPCFRCGKEIDSPNSSNADYIMAEDTIATVIEDGIPKGVQKTGIVCPECHKPKDFVIWGVHKGQGEEGKK